MNFEGFFGLLGVGFFGEEVVLFSVGDGVFGEDFGRAGENRDFDEDEGVFAFVLSDDFHFSDTGLEFAGRIVERFGVFGECPRKIWNDEWNDHSAGVG